MGAGLPLLAPLSSDPWPDCGAGTQEVEVFHDPKPVSRGIKAAQHIRQVRLASNCPHFEDSPAHAVTELGGNCSASAASGLVTRGCVMQLCAASHSARPCCVAFWWAHQVIMHTCEFQPAEPPNPVALHKQFLCRLQGTLLGFYRNNAIQARHDTAASVEHLAQRLEAETKEGMTAIPQGACIPQDGRFDRLLYFLVRFALRSLVSAEWLDVDIEA